jgi:hypothetical protein
MKGRKILTATFAVAALTLMAGCGSAGTIGTSSPVPTPTSAKPSSSVNGAPVVENPLNTSTIDSSPCDVATQGQVETLGMKLQSAQVTSSPPRSSYCTWTFDNRAGTINGGTVLENTAGLGSLYAKKSSGQLTHFQPISPIAGYPAVIYANGAQIGDGFCSLAVGVRNDLTYTVDTNLHSASPHYNDPCAAAQKIAEFAIQYLKGRQ